MNEAALRERRASRRRQVRRRRRTVLAAALVALLGLVAMLTSGGPAGSDVRHEATTVGTAGAQAAAGTSTAPGRAASGPAPRSSPAAAAAGGPAGSVGRRAATMVHARAPAAGRTADATAPTGRGTRTTAGAELPAGGSATRARVAWPGAHRAPREPVPILMYHVIGTRSPLTTNPGLWVTAAEFAAHVRALRHAGYHAITLQDAWNAWHRHGELPRKPVVLSFDDGYAGQVRDALPILAAVGWAGVLNLEVHNLADIGGTKAVKRLVAAGWEIDAHTISHPDLTTLGSDALHHEVAGSRARLRRLLSVPVNFFCYPSGRYDARVIAAVKAAGYLAATTTQPGWASPAGDAFALSRVRVDGAMTAAAVLQRLRDTRATS
jgi:peptidoglycan/xylan/chitin deacetylase (PgdA/CDA1 family)